MKLKISGIRKVLKGAGATAEVARVARRGARDAGEGFEAVIRPGRYTARALIWTADETGRKRQSDEAVLERVMGSLG